MNLPIEFEEKMQDLLGGEYNDYLKCYEEPRHYGLRVNTSKISIDRFLEIAHGRFVRFRGLKTVFIMMEKNISLQSTRIILRDCTICRNQAQ